MINIDEYDILKNNKSSLKELSKDDSDINNILYMTESDIEAINYDYVKTQYVNSLGLSEETANSVDGIMYNTPYITFVEFKNGKMKNEKRKVKDKIKDSLLIFSDITGKNISFLRENMDFILVYNNEKNPLPNQMTKGYVQESKSRDYIAGNLMKKAKEEFIRFDLERFKKLYFRDVHTYTEVEFEAFLERC